MDPKVFKEHTVSDRSGVQTPVRTSPLWAGNFATEPAYVT